MSESQSTGCKMRKVGLPFIIFTLFHIATIIAFMYYFFTLLQPPQRPPRYLRDEKDARARELQQQHQNARVNMISNQMVQGYNSISVNNKQRPEETIPKIIHQIWNDIYIPREFIDNVKGLVRDNKPPSWNYFLWTMSSAKKFIKDLYPQYLDMYLTLEDNITRSDVIRYLVLYEYGGVYFDLDTVSVKPLDDFVDNHGCAFVNEPLEHISLVYNMHMLLTNAAMLCRPKHPFILNILDTLESYRQVTKCSGAFECTGPLALTRLYMYYTRVRLHEYDDIAIAPTEYFQSIYDEDVLKRDVTLLCKNLPRLIGDQNDACAQLKTRTKSRNAPSSEAYTYHTWHHVTSKGVTVSREDNIQSIVPHVKMYGTDF